MGRLKIAVDDLIAFNLCMNTILREKQADGTVVITYDDIDDLIEETSFKMHFYGELMRKIVEEKGYEPPTDRQIWEINQ